MNSDTPQNKKEIIINGRSQGYMDEAQHPGELASPDERVRQMTAIEKAMDIQDEAQKKAIARGLPYTNTTSFYTDEYDRPLSYWDPKTRQSHPKISIPICTSINIIKISNKKAIVEVDNFRHAGQFTIKADAITYPADPGKTAGGPETRENK